MSFKSAILRFFVMFSSNPRLQFKKHHQLTEFRNINLFSLLENREVILYYLLKINFIYHNNCRIKQISLKCRRFSENEKETVISKFENI